VLPVPLVAWLFRVHGAMSRGEVERGVSGLLQRLPHAMVHLPRDNRDYAAEVGLRNLVERGALRLEGDRYVPEPGMEGLLAFYANSIGHLLPGPDAAAAKGDAATAGL